MTYKNLILITLNNTLHIKADNLEPVEVDSSCVNKLLNYTKKDRLGITGNLSSGWYIDIEKGLPISELSDRIEVREVTTHHKSDVIKTYKAFLLPAKEDKVITKTISQFHGDKFVTINGVNYYPIEEIESALRITNDNEGQPITDRFITNYINNLKK